MSSILKKYFLKYLTLTNNYVYNDYRDHNGDHFKINII